MKKISVNSEFSFYFALVLIAFGVRCLELSDLGMPVVQSTSYILSEKITWLSFGMSNYIVQVVLLGALAVITKKINVYYIVSFLNAFVYGLIVDGVTLVTKTLAVPDLFAGRLGYLFAGFWLVVFGVILFFRTNVPLMPYDMFVKQLALFKKWNINKLKIIYDLSWLLLAIPLSFILFGKLTGIGWGTVVCALLSGVAIAYVGKLTDKVFIFRPKFTRLFPDPPAVAAEAQQEGKAPQSNNDNV